MSPRKTLVAAILALTSCNLGAENLPSGGEVGPGVPPFSVRPGYRVTLAAEKLGEARAMEFDDKGTLYLSQPAAGAIQALRDTDGDGVYETVTPFVTNLPKVHAMSFHDGWLWFAQTGAILKARDTNGDGKADEVVTVLANLPSGGGHWWRSLLVTDDGFYTSIGDSGNTNDESATDRQKIWHYDLKGGSKALFASGIRNTEKLRLRPGTNEVWGVDHGSDNFGGPLGEKVGKGQKFQPVTDFNPPCEFNHYVLGGFYGHPFIVGNRVPRIEFQKRPDILELAAKTIPPAWSFGAHWAPNGFTFLTKDTFPAQRGDAFVALHGSWNSSVKVGYRVERVMFDPFTGDPCGAQCIVSTLAPDGTNVLDRPVDCVEAPDGSVLFSSDSGKRIYRITWTGTPANPGTPVPASTPRRASAASSAPTSKAPELPELAAISYFNANCARCHGPFGSFYGKRSYHPYPVLAADIKQMAEGPSDAPLSEKALAAQVAYHQSLYDLKPFIAWVGQDGQLISGEVTPGSKVTIVSGGKPIDARVEDYRWSATLPDGVKPGQVEIRAQNATGETVLALKNSPFSHFQPGQPLPLGK
jgi:glucose/arabinose dehydrogenase